MIARGVKKAGRVISFSFDEAVNRELKRINSNMRKIIDEETYNIIAKGLYVYHLERWMKLFPRYQFLVLSNEDLAQDPAGLMKQVFYFLGLPEYKNINYTPRNVGSYSKDIDPD